MLMSYLFVHVTSSTPSPSTLYTVTKRFAYDNHVSSWIYAQPARLREGIL